MSDEPVNGSRCKKITERLQRLLWGRPRGFYLPFACCAFRMDHTGGSYFHSSQEGDQSAYNTRVDHFLFLPGTAIILIYASIQLPSFQPFTISTSLSDRTPDTLGTLFIRCASPPWGLVSFTSSKKNFCVPICPAMYPYWFLHVVHYSARVFGCQPRGLVLCPTAPGAT